MKLRYYQTQAVTAALNAYYNNKNYSLISMATGTGKSLVIAEIARSLDCKVLCIQPSQELLTQNYEKFKQFSDDCCYFSASMNQKRNDSRVIYGTIGTIRNHLDDGSFSGIGAVIIDESHLQTDKAISIANHVGAFTIGLTATPYRMQTGYIYRHEQSTRYYFNKMIYEYSARQALNDGYTSPIDILQPSAKFDTSSVPLSSTGDFNLSDYRMVEQQNKLTAKICFSIRDTIKRYDLKKVLVYAQSVTHAEKIKRALGSDSESISSKVGKHDRQKIIEDFKNGKTKILVNVDILTVGFDCPEVDFIAILRPTKSPTLHQQIAGRGSRIAEGKDGCLLIDYTQNMDNLYQNQDIYEPIIQPKKKSNTKPQEIYCPDCHTEHTVTLKPNPEGWLVSRSGYFTDLNGNAIESSHQTPQCKNCGHWWQYQSCRKCNAKNTISTRYCTNCNHEMINPDKHLRINDEVDNDLVSGVKCTFQESPRSIIYNLILIVQLRDGNKLDFYLSKKQLRELGITGNFYKALRKLKRINIRSISYIKTKKGYKLKKITER